MIRINLLPADARRARSLSMDKVPRSPLIALAAAFLLLLPVGLLGLKAADQARLKRLSAILQTLAPKKQEADRLKVEADALREQQRLIDQLNQRRSHWAQRLNALSDAVPDGIWLTDLIVEPQRSITLKGDSIAQSGEEMVQIGRLLQDLKGSPAFAGVLTQLEIESINSKQDGTIELAEFSLNGKLTESAP